MTRVSRSLLLQEEIELLVRHFGIHRVRAAVKKFSTDLNETMPSRRAMPNGTKPIRPTVAEVLELARRSDPAKYHLLSEFLVRLRKRETLPESQDIRQFAELSGLRDINGKSRKEMIPTLMRFLVERDTERLRSDIKRADTISEQQRREGYSVLTDKLLGQR